MSEIWGDLVWEVLMFCEREIEETGESDAGRGCFYLSGFRPADAGKIDSHDPACFTPRDSVLECVRHASG